MTQQEQQEQQKHEDQNRADRQYAHSLVKLVVPITSPLYNDVFASIMAAIVHTREEMRVTYSPTKGKKQDQAIEEWAYGIAAQPENSLEKVCRMAVPGGWLVKVDQSLTFLPDPEHAWDGKPVIIPQAKKQERE